MTETKQYEVQMQMRQWGNIITWVPQALIEAADDAEAIRKYQERDDWRRHRVMIAGPADRLVRRHSDGPMRDREVLASRGTHIATNGEKRRAANAKRRAAKH